ncbi:MAG: HD domain-containing protein [Flavobacteriales bacterium]|nr:HD domain-containing protein [Flavobacteriales bacterium]HRH67890.1 HD domain-containing protein [Flavobacteriales bacterium]
MDPQGARAFILDKLRRELPAARSYHSLEHTLDVYASVVDIAEKEGISGDGLTLLKIAALYHDAGFTEQDLDHEEAGCRIARAKLPEYGFGAEQIELICEMIMATRIPQSPRNKLARILCDADLDYLGRPDFIPIGTTLFKEMRHYGVLKSEREWNELQVRFLERHKYFTRTNKESREPRKQEHLLEVKAWLQANT